MGSDNLFHRRKAKNANQLRRRRARRAPYEKVLIVCEGKKTEPYYFKECVQFYKLNMANVEVDGDCGSSPKSVLQRAIELWSEANQKDDPYDRVYCVFDKDDHTTYDETIRKISEYEPRGIFYAVVSVPCFEYWLLLHFKYTTKPYVARGNRSVGVEVLRALKEEIPGYKKGDKNIFRALFEQIECAKANAAKSLQHAQDRCDDNPSTNVHELIDYLEKLRR